MKGIDEQHSFSPHIAAIVGIEKAILLKNIYYWCKENQARGINFHEGRYWTYNSASSLEAIYPYMKRRSIARWVSELNEDGWIEIGNFNKAGFDRTTWYSINADKYDQAILNAVGHFDQSIGQNGQRIGQNGQPIPLVNNNNSLSTKSVNRDHKVAQALETIKSQVGDSLATMATVFTEISPGDLNLQVEKWLKYYIGNDEVMSDPIEALTTGPCSFERWIERAKDVTKKRKPKDMTIVYNSYLKWVKENYSDVKPLSSDEYLGIEAYKKRCELRDQTIIMGLVSSSHYDVFFSGGDLVEILNSKLSSNRYPTIEEMAALISQPA